MQINVIVVITRSPRQVEEATRFLELFAEQSGPGSFSVLCASQDVRDRMTQGRSGPGDDDFTLSSGSPLVSLPDPVAQFITRHLKVQQLIGRFLNLFFIVGDLESLGPWSSWSMSLASRKRRVVVVDDGLSSVPLARIAQHLGLPNVEFFSSYSGFINVSQHSAISYPKRTPVAKFVDHQTLGVLGGPICELHNFSTGDYIRLMDNARRVAGATKILYLQHRREEDKFAGFSWIEVLPTPQGSITALERLPTWPLYFWSLYSSALVDVFMLRPHQPELFLYTKLSDETIRRMSRDSYKQFGIMTIEVTYEVFHQLGFQRT